MKTAHLLAGAPDGGAELFFERLLPALAAAGDDILPIVRGAARAARLRGAGLSATTVPFAGTLDPFTRPRIAWRLRRFAPRVAVAWMGRAAQHAPTGPWVLVGRLGGQYSLSRFRRCDHLVANTPALAAWITAQGWPADRTHYLPNFVPDLAGAAPAILPIPPGAPRILAMGRLHRDKGFDILLAAIARLPAAHAIIAGNGPERRSLESLARRAGIADRVHFLGWRPDTAALLAACDVLVCPSRREPLGNQILEAFSAGKPVVAAMAEGPSWLLDHGRRGILVPVDSAIALAAGIEGVLQNPAQSAAFAAAGRACYARQFAVPGVVAAWREFCATVEKPACRDAVRNLNSTPNLAADEPSCAP